MNMKNYTAPAYVIADVGNNIFNILGISVELNQEDNSVVITQDAENIFG